MRRIAHVVFLTAIWVLLWGRLSVANVLTGVAVSIALNVFFPTGASEGDPAQMGASSTPQRVFGWFRPLAIGRLVGHVVVQLFASNAFIAREIITPGSRVRTGIVACRLRTDSERMITFLANILSLSPGLMPVHVQSAPPALYVHVLHLYDPEQTRQRIAHLEWLAVRAFGSAQQVALLDDEVHEQGAGLDVTQGAINDGGPT